MRDALLSPACTSSAASPARGSCSMAGLCGESIVASPSRRRSDRARAVSQSCAYESTACVSSNRKRGEVGYDNHVPDGEVDGAVVELRARPATDRGRAQKSDNGSSFASTRAPGELTALSAWWVFGNHRGSQPTGASAGQRWARADASGHEVRAGGQDVTTVPPAGLVWSVDLTGVLPDRRADRRTDRRSITPALHAAAPPRGISGQETTPCAIAPPSLSASAASSGP
jgi:hypothetical protein